MSDSEFLPGWKKYPGVAETMIKASIPMTRGSPYRLIIGPDADADAGIAPLGADRPLSETIAPLAVLIGHFLNIVLKTPNYYRIWISAGSIEIQPF
ncbi:MAG: hypothetical protein V2B19_14425 [Pseudomonadota bacterium]